MLCKSTYQTPQCIYKESGLHCGNCCTCTILSMLSWPTETTELFHEIITVLFEITKLSSVACKTLFHSLQKGIIVNGYTKLLASIWVVHVDSEVTILIWKCYMTKVHKQLLFVNLKIQVMIKQDGQKSSDTNRMYMYFWK